MIRTLALPVVLDRYAIVGAGLNGGSSFGNWLEKWRGAQGVRILVSSDYRDAIVVPDDLDLERDDRTGMFRVPDEVLP